MSYEARIIRQINAVMPVSPLRLSRPSEVDSELVRLGEGEYLFSTDDFSSEDLLPETDPRALGWNLACGAISDIIAAGGKPLAYAHSMVIPPGWSERYVRSFSRGIVKALQRYSTSFIGGDLGFSESWRYTASVIGAPPGRTLNRRGCRPGDAIFLTGRAGAGNLAAISRLFAGHEGIQKLLQGVKIKFPSHERLPRILAQYASSAIDTSDGVFNALRAIADLNGTGFQVHDPTLIPKGVKAARMLRLPELALFLGEGGEYEILFTVSEQNKQALKNELREQAIAACELGVICKNKRRRTVTWKNASHDLAQYCLSARDYDSPGDYLRDMTAWLARTGVQR